MIRKLECFIWRLKWVSTSILHDLHRNGSCASNLWLKFDLWLWLQKKKISKYLKYVKANLLSTFVLKYDDKKETPCDMHVWLNKSHTLKGKFVIMIIIIINFIWITLKNTLVMEHKLNLYIFVFYCNKWYIPLTYINLC